MIKFLKVLICGQALVLLGNKVVAQQVNPHESQYFTNQYLANPGMVGQEPNMAVFNVAYRNQWSNVPGSPISMLLTGEYRGGKEASFGFQVVNQESGMLTQTRVMGSYAYRVRFAEKGHSLKMGLSLGWTRDRLDYAKAIGDMSDAAIYDFNSRNSTWDADAGIVYDNQDFTFQASMSNMRRTFSKEYSDNSDYPTFYLSANYKIHLSDEVMVNPKVAYRGIHNFDAVADLGAELTFKEPLQLMGMYHTNGSISGGASYLFDQKWQVFGIYSSASTELRNYGGSTFEFGLAFKLTAKARSSARPASDNK